MTPEFSRPVRLDTLGEGAREVSVEADAAECAALAARFGLLGVERLDATATLSRSGSVVAAQGRVRARVVQACVGSGEALNATIDEPFALRFVPETESTPDAEIELDADALDELPYAGGSIDLGEAVAETLSLAIDPFPRGPNADAALREAGVTDGSDASPFAALKGLFGKD